MRRQQSTLQRSLLEIRSYPENPEESFALFHGELTIGRQEADKESTPRQEVVKIV
jgi:hypothetical protein